MKSERTYKMVLSGLFAALCCVATLVHIPAGVTGGYVNMGDAFVVCAGIFLGAKWGALSAGIGSCLADFILGYSYYAPATFIIKALMAFLSGAFYKKQSSKKALSKLMITFLAEFIMVAGYIVFEWVFLGYGAGCLANFPTSLVQAVASLIVIVPLVRIIEKTKLIK